MSIHVDTRVAFKTASPTKSCPSYKTDSYISGVFHTCWKAQQCERRRWRRSLDSYLTYFLEARTVVEKGWRAMIAVRHSNALRAVSALAVTCLSAHVKGFSLTVRQAVSPSTTTAVSRHSTYVGSLGASATAGATDFGSMLGDKVASAIVSSPVYPLLVRQAKDTMKKSAEVCPVEVVGKLLMFSCLFMLILVDTPIMWFFVQYAQVARRALQVYL